MNKIFKWILGIFTTIGGILLAVFLGSKKNKKVKEIKREIKKTDSQIKEVKKQNDAVKKSLESKKEALKEIKSKKYKKKDVSSKEASDFLKKYSKHKK